MLPDYSQYAQLVYAIIGAAMKVYAEMNWGLLEPLYNEALGMELTDCGIENETHKLLPCFYKGRKMEKYYEMDLVVGDIVVELKSVKEIIPAHRAQLFNYMRLTQRPIGLLINFGQPSLQGERYGLDLDTNECHLLDKKMQIVPSQQDCWDDDTPQAFANK